MWKILSSPRLLFGIYMMAAIATALQQWWLPGNIEGYTHYNNFVIFKNAFHHLLQGDNLYLPYPQKQYDLYKYSPTFALAMGPLAMLPDLAGLILWNMLNAGVLWLGIRTLPLPIRIQAAIAWFCLIELITSLQNAQSNGLIAGLLLLAFTGLEKGQVGKATLWINITVFIKLFGGVALVQGIFSKRKWYFGLAALGWAMVLALLPALFIPFSSLVQQYQNWWQLLASDYAASIGLSVAGWLQSWFGLAPPKHWITLTGIVLLALPLLRYSCFPATSFRMKYFSALCIWMVIFNHKAESSTFIIAVCGIALWYFSQAPSPFNTTLMVLVFLFTILSPVDVYPPSLRQQVFVPFVIKVVPCICVWAKIIFELMHRDFCGGNRVSSLNRSAPPELA
ncbi:MAG: DUF2029 domain-containing protein [Chitinophagales bacterium]|nr:DUF2029 domain-containing protein [Chitinophagales bacterium]MDW8427496.1 glycosyltransferase family 87 protein [Chitinophagales bacterium]